MAGWATVTIVTSSSSMNIPAHTAIRAHHFLSIGFPPSGRLFPWRSPSCWVNRDLKIHDEARLCWISTQNILTYVESLTLDAMDRQIIHILAVEPRASFRTIADVTGISDQTAARRYRRLCDTVGLRVLGMPDGSRLGWTN